MENIKEFVVLSESVRFPRVGVTVFRGDTIGKDHPCFEHILPYQNGYDNKIPSKNQFKAVKETVDSKPEVKDVVEAPMANVEPEVKSDKVEQVKEPVKAKAPKKKQV